MHIAGGDQAMGDPQGSTRVPLKIISQKFLQNGFLTPKNNTICDQGLHFETLRSRHLQPKKQTPGSQAGTGYCSSLSQLSQE